MTDEMTAREAAATKTEGKREHSEVPDVGIAVTEGSPDTCNGTNGRESQKRLRLNSDESSDASSGGLSLNVAYCVQEFKTSVRNLLKVFAEGMFVTFAKRKVRFHRFVRGIMSGDAGVTGR